MIKFHPATTDDYADICQLVTSEEELFRVYPNGSYPLTTTQLEKLSRERIELTVAELKGKVVGFANLYNYAPSQHAFIGNVILDEAYRGHGYGRKIVEHMLNIAQEKLELPEIHISVFANNTPALLLYHTFGFTPYSMEERKDFSGRRAALIHLKKSLHD